MYIQKQNEEKFSYRLLCLKSVSKKLQKTNVTLEK